ncbi:redox-sensing transcriptional repressor Rex [Levilactobacillus zymae]|uniref:Redox-sensing transcriptional repressor Rex n=1 Tax=Levilactobacillus zymae TaxID=267363 RepID=A0A1Y6JV23_9LACO|nr:redox-sensing transcriptional repressor Rex [Levilactobacillus zymae]KRL12144.1 redox-sensing transcriptional repressor Rex [Levilactobacillus zymae DSM 19395]MDT6980072.1 redox-sensing transcriptional repressor Rex [Levilactobacillus zymae]QFR61291.1 redox-sensing transcriptional repressor Rex [Levilactobacillus zymae]SMS13705.1 Redox-sensitive transcriptional regulator (AT-rich DNA-binding protein) [Levilactobacillus zymae]GEO72487.1 redox-sensing transcriptional repressor Rex [Levilactob
MTEQKIPRATAKRLPIYYRYLNILLDADKTRVSSTELSEAVKVDSATIRRDFSYFGALGKRGYGYDVESLIKFFRKILNQDRLTNVALIGVGNMGHALLNFNFHQDSNVRISAAFDINEDIANTIQSGVPIYPMTDLRTQLEEQQIQVAILTVPSDVAQEVTNEAVAGGIKGILNFTPLRITVPKGVRVQNVDLTNELQTLIYFLEHYNHKD